MTFVSRDATDDQLISVVRDWVDVLSREDYAAVFEALGYSLAFDRPGAEAICEDIKRYRSPEFYPGTETFAVSDWRTARGGNPSPTVQVRWYKPTTSLRIVGVVDYDLPLNGRWSDLEANFVLFENDDPEGYALVLEDISSPGREG